MDGVVVHDVASSLQDLVMMEKGNRILEGGVCKHCFVFRITPGIYFFANFRALLACPSWDVGTV